MPSLTIENYVKTIWEICERQTEGAAATGRVASALDVSPGTVTSMLKTLSDSGLAAYTPYEGVRLTDAGRLLAMRVIRRHRLIELFLVKTLQLNWDEVHEEAENMEHAVSEYLVDRMDDFLQHPEVDPHGDPIPKSDGTLAPNAHRNLTDVNLGTRFRIVRVLDQSPEFLRYLSDTGLQPGVEGHLIEKRSEAGTLTIEISRRRLTLSNEAASKLLITSAD